MFFRVFLECGSRLVIDFVRRLSTATAEQRLSIATFYRKKFSRWHSSLMSKKKSICLKTQPESKTNVLKRNTSVYCLVKRIVFVNISNRYLWLNHFIFGKILEIHWKRIGPVDYATHLRTGLNIRNEVLFYKELHCCSKHRGA